MIIEKRQIELKSWYYNYLRISSKINLKSIICYKVNVCDKFKGSYEH